MSVGEHGDSLWFWVGVSFLNLNFDVDGDFLFCPSAFGKAISRLGPIIAEIMTGGGGGGGGVNFTFTKAKQRIASNRLGLP